MYLFYFDECGNIQTNVKSIAAYPWFALGAVAIHDQQWRALGVDLDALKHRYFTDMLPEEIEIKSALLRAWGTPRVQLPWARLNANQMRALVDEFYALYQRYALTLFFAVVDKRSYMQSASPNEPLYAHAFDALLAALERFLIERDDIGLCFLDEFKGVDRQVIGRYTWRKRAIQAARVERIVEPPSFVSSRFSPMISLADIVVYNVYRRYREDAPQYSYFQRIAPHIYRDPQTGTMDDAGMILLPKR
ncbi:MAG: DUF3800 domain-containing protein [Chloroflexota bacterium]